MVWYRPIILYYPLCYIYCNSDVDMVLHGWRLMGFYQTGVPSNNERGEWVDMRTGLLGCRHPCWHQFWYVCSTRQAPSVYNAPSMYNFGCNKKNNVSRIEICTKLADIQGGGCRFQVPLQPQNGLGHTRAVSGVFCFNMSSKPQTTQGGPMGFWVGPMTLNSKIVQNLPNIMGQCCFQVPLNPKTAWATLWPYQVCSFGISLQNCRPPRVAQCM